MALIDIAKPYNIEITSKQEEKFENFYELLVFWNKKINLTAITEKEDVYIKHFLDCIYLSRYVSDKIIDIGTGAGFPGIPLAIMNESLDITLLDSLNKRCNFLSEVRNELNLNFEIICGRAEEIAREEQYRERFDFAVSRAVAPLNILSELCLPYVKKSGTFYSMKGSNAEKEVEEALGIIAKLRGDSPKITKYFLPDNIEHCLSPQEANPIGAGEGQQRCIVEIKKNKNTPTIYPRQFNQIKKG